MFTKKHYEVMATALASVRPKITEPCPEGVAEWYHRRILTARDDQWKQTVTQMCDLFKLYNPKFDPDRFMEWINNQP